MKSGKAFESYFHSQKTRNLGSKGAGLGEIHILSWENEEFCKMC
jgi:hypothetical protein